MLVQITLAAPGCVFLLIYIQALCFRGRNAAREAFKDDRRRALQSLQSRDLFHPNINLSVLTEKILPLPVFFIPSSHVSEHPL